MKKIGKLLDYFMTGVGFGAIAYLLILTFVENGATPTPRGVVSIFIISGLIGILSMIFKTDLSLTLSLGVHLVGTFIAFLVMAIINNWQLGVPSISLFFSIYLVIWLILILEQKKTINQLNIKIRDRQNQEKH